MTEPAKQQTQVQRLDDVPSLLERMKDQIAKALPKHLTVDRMSRIALTVFRGYSAEVQKGLDPLSFVGAIIVCSQLGLEPGPGLDQVYLIPFKNGKRSAAAKRDIYEIQVIPGYQGKLQLVRNSGQLETVGAAVIYETDKFSFAVGPGQKPPKHSWGLKDKRERQNIVGVWAWAELTGGKPQWEILSLDEIEKARSFSRSANSESSPWNKHFEAMAKKTAIHRLAKLLPKSIEKSGPLLQANELETAAEMGVSQNHQVVIDTTFVPDYAPTEDLSAINYEGEKQTKEHLLKEAKKQFDEVFNKLPTGMPIPETLRELGLMDANVTRTWSADNWHAATEILLEHLAEKK